MIAGGGPTKLLIPARAAGAVIGKQGSGLKALREAHSVQLELQTSQQAPMWLQDRVVIVKGSTEARQAAADALLRLVFQNEEHMATLKMLVPASAAGAVIGKQGSMLKMIREHCGTNLKVERDEIVGERLIMAQGPLDRVLLGCSAVISVLAGTGPCGEPLVPPDPSAELLDSAQPQQPAQQA